MKLIRTEEAVGQVLCHDITQIIKDEKKDAVFRKGRHPPGRRPCAFKRGKGLHIFGKTMTPCFMKTMPP